MPADEANAPASCLRFEGCLRVSYIMEVQCIRQNPAVTRTTYVLALPAKFCRAKFAFSSNVRALRASCARYTFEQAKSSSAVSLSQQFRWE